MDDTTNKVFVVLATHQVCADLKTAVRYAASDLASKYSVNKVGAPCVVSRLGWEYRVSTLDCEGHLRYRTIMPQTPATGWDSAEVPPIYSEYEEVE